MDFYSASSLKLQSVERHVAPRYLDSDPNSFVLPPITVFIAEKKQIPTLVFGLS